MQLNSISTSIDLFDIAMIFMTGFFGLVIILLLLQNKKRNSKLEQMSFAAYEASVKRAHKKADQIISTASKRARRVIVAAELESIKRIAHQKVEDRNLHEKYEASLGSMSTELHEGMDVYADQIDAFFKKTFDTFRSTTDTALSKNIDNMNAMTNEIVSRIDKKLNDFESNASKQYVESLEKQLKKVKESIATYRTERMAFIDERINDIVQHVAKQTIGQTLELQDHETLVLKSLDEAKKEGFI